MMGLVARASSTPTPYVVPPSKQFDGNDGSWSTFKISVGTPGQDFRVLPSTKSGATYVIAPDGCEQGVDPADCPQRRGIDVFNSAQNTGFQTNVSTTWSQVGLYDADLEKALNYTAKGLFGLDKVALGAASNPNVLSLSKQVVAGIGELDYFLGYLPLGQAENSFNSLSNPIDSLLFQLRNNSNIPSFSYAYTAGAKYRLKSVFGSLVLGGYDSTRFKPNSNDFSFTFSDNPSKLLTVGVESITATGTLKGTFSMSSGAHFSVIDSSVPHLWLPTNICSQFEEAFGLTYDAKTDLYLVNDTIHQRLLANNPLITIKLANSIQDTTTNYTNIQLPYAAFDLQASYPFYQNATNYFPIRRAANDSQFTLGRTLLQEAYLIVDYERANFTIAQAAFPDPLPAANVLTITSPSDKPTTSKSSSLSTGAIVGIAIGSALLVLLALLALFFLRRHRRRRDPKRYELGDTRLTSSSSSHLPANSATPLKSQGPSELSGTPLTELASPVVANTNHWPNDQKTFISAADEPQELHAESRTPITPRWQEVYLPLPEPRTPRTPRSPHDGDSGSEAISQVHTDDGYISAEGPRSGVSPMTGQFSHR